MRLTVPLCAGLLCAAAFSQAPEFIQQYKQRLGGAIDELARIVRHFDQSAETAGLTRDAALHRFEQTGDPFLAGRGQAMRETVVRWHDLSDHWRALDAATAMSRLPVFISGLDAELAERTWQDYRPAIPTTEESLLHGGFGFAVGHLLIAALLSPLRRRRVAEPPAPERGRERRYS